MPGGGAGAGSSSIRRSVGSEPAKRDIRPGDEFEHALHDALLDDELDESALARDDAFGDDVSCDERELAQPTRCGN